MRDIRVKCKCCNGVGSITLTGVYADTLRLLARQIEEVSGADLARLAGCKGEAMCMRLVALKKHGLVISRPYGRKRLWRVAQ